MSSLSLARPDPRPALRLGLIVCFAAVFLAASGALDTEAAALAPRFFYWFLVTGLGFGALEAAYRAAKRRLPELPSPTLRIAALALLFLPLTGAAMLVCIAFFGGTISLGRFLALLPGITSILAAAQLLLELLPAAAAGRPEADDASVALDLAARLPLPLRSAPIHALEAEDHYVRVHTAEGAALVRMRLADAIATMGTGAGERAHRSWWVATGAVIAVRKAHGRTWLVLPSGQEVPVSRTLARQFGPSFRS